MPGLTRHRLQLEPPGVARPSSTPVATGKTNAMPAIGGDSKTTWYGSPPPAVLVARHLAAPTTGVAMVAPTPKSEGDACAPGCLRGVHVGYCLTKDGLAPPSVKKLHASSDIPGGLDPPLHAMLNNAILVFADQQLRDRITLCSQDTSRSRRARADSEASALLTRYT